MRAKHSYPQTTPRFCLRQQIPKLICAASGLNAYGRALFGQRTRAVIHLRYKRMFKPVLAPARLAGRWPTQSPRLEWGSQETGRSQFLKPAEGRFSVLQITQLQNFPITQSPRNPQPVVTSNLYSQFNSRDHGRGRDSRVNPQRRDPKSFVSWILVSKFFRRRILRRISR
jgi:hypothetical protein